MDFTGQPRILARKSFKICHMCKGKGYVEETPSSIYNIMSMKMQVDATSQKNITCNESKVPEDDNSSVPNFKLQESSGRFQCKVEKQYDSLLDRSSLILPNKLKINDSLPSTPRSNTRHMGLKVKSFGSEGSLCSETADLINFDKEFSDIQESVKQAKVKMKSTDWDTVMLGLEDIGTLCYQFSKDNNNDETQSNPTFKIIDWGTLGQAMTKLVSSLHVQKSRTVRLTCQILRELFRTMTQTVHRPQFDNAVNELIKRTADTSRMIRCDAHQALDTMIRHVPVQFSTRAILNQAPRHKNPVVRRTAMRLLDSLVRSLTPNVLMNQAQLKEPRKQIMNTLCILIDDPNQHVRWLVRKIVQTLMSEECFEDVINVDVEPQILKKADRSLVLIQYKNETL